MNLKSLHGLILLSFQLYPLKSFVLKKELCLSEWPGFFYNAFLFILSFKIQFFLKLNFFFVFSSI